MPELPEVETIVRKLKAVLPGKKITAVCLFHPKTWQGLPTSQVIGRQVESVTRRAKIIQIFLVSAPDEPADEPVQLLVHLKMTGQLIYVDPRQRLGGGHPTADWVSDLPSKHTRVGLDFTDNAHLFFNDQRLFGWIKAVTASEAALIFSTIGPDVIDDQVTLEYLAPFFKRRSQAIKQVIMDSSLIAGVGNIYACDALNLAQINPHRPAKSLSDQEISKLLASMKQVINQGIELGGTTFDGKYVDIDGLAGTYQTVVRVYGRAGKKCLFCEGEITKTKLGGRGTYFCPVCQV